MKKAASIFAAFVALTAAALIVMVLVKGCDGDHPHTPAPEPDPVEDLADAAGTTTAVVDKKRWATIDDLKVVLGSWHSKQVHVTFTSKKHTKKYKSMYPWRVDVDFQTDGGQHKPLRCGFYGSRTDDWHLAYCSGYNKDPKDGSYAVRLLLHGEVGDPNRVRLQISNVAEFELERQTELGE